MTETPHQTQAQPPGWNTQNLKDYRQLRRAREERKVAGVAGGLARHLDVDPTILRVLFVVLAFFGGAGFLLYGALWLLVPEEGSERTVLRTNDATRNALLLIVAGVAALIAVGDSMHGFGFPWVIAVALVVAAVLLTRDRNQTGPPPPQAPAPTPAPWASSGSPTAAVPTSPAPTAPVPTYSTPVSTAVPPFAPPPGSPPVPPPVAPPAAPWYPVPPRPPKKGALLFGPTLALIALGLGALGLYDASGGSVADSAYPALALAITGLMLLVGAFVGRAGGLILVGMLSALLLVVTAIGHPSFRGDRNLVVRPVSAEQLHDSYEVPAGRLELDLSRISDPQTLDGRTIDVSANAGEIVVVVPRNVDVVYSASVQYGGLVDTPTASRNGWAPSVSSTIDSPRSDATLTINVDLEFGHIQLERAGGIPVPAPAPRAPRSTR